MKGREVFRTVTIKKGPFQDFEPEELAFDIPKDVILPPIGSRFVYWDDNRKFNISGRVKDIQYSLHIGHRNEVSITVYVDEE